MKKAESAEEVIDMFDDKPESEYGFREVMSDILNPKWLKYILIGYIGALMFKAIELVVDWNTLYQASVIVLLVWIIIDVRVEITYNKDKKMNDG